MTTVPLKESVYELTKGEPFDKRRKEVEQPHWGWTIFNEHWNYKDNDCKYSKNRAVLK